MLYAWNTNLWKYGFFLTVFSNKPTNRTDPNGTKPTSLVRFLLWKTVKKTETNWTNEDFIVRTFFLNQKLIQIEP
jgi:hypothetical protein